MSIAKYFFVIVLLSWSHLPMAAESIEDDKGKMTFAFVLLAEPRMPTGEAIVKEFAAFAEKNQQLKYEKPTTEESEKETLAFELEPCGMAVVGLLRAPIPDNEADEAARFSFSAIYSDWKLPRHKAHLLVTVANLTAESNSPVTKLSCITALLAAVSKATDAVGIYWGEAGATHDPTTFQSMAQRPQLAPKLTLWTGVSVARERSGRLSLLSLGMKQLGLPDLLLTAPEKTDTQELFGMFFDLLSYVTQRGEPLPDGDTIGRENGERVPVHYVPSPIDKSKQVWRIELK